MIERGVSLYLYAGDVCSTIYTTVYLSAGNTSYVWFNDILIFLIFRQWREPQDPFLGSTACSITAALLSSLVYPAAPSCLCKLSKPSTQQQHSCHIRYTQQRPAAFVSCQSHQHSSGAAVISCIPPSQWDTNIVLQPPTSYVSCPIACSTTAVICQSR